MNDSTVGNHTTFSDHSHQMEMKPLRSPNAWRTQAYTPPPCGQAVASSPATSESGRKKVMRPRRYQKIMDQPSSAMDGKLRMLSTAVTSIIARAKTPSAAFLATPEAAPPPRLALPAPPAAWPAPPAVPPAPLPSATAQPSFTSVST